MMSVSYDVFAEAFLNKVVDYDFPLKDYTRNGVIDGYMRRAISAFKNVCKYDLSTTRDDAIRTFDIDISDEDMDEIVDIVSEGMLVQWMKPYMYQQENLQNILNTKDFSSYSPAELLYRVREAYEMAKKDFTNMIRDYSYNHGDLTVLHI